MVIVYMVLWSDLHVYHAFSISDDKILASLINLLIQIYMLAHLSNLLVNKR